MAVKAQSTQGFVPIEEVKDGVIILKDGGMRSALLCSSINFSLKSEDEKSAIILQFQDFLNSLDFSVQIFIQSRKFDIRPYLALLENQRKAQMNSLMKIQTEEYIEFIKNFTENINIMTKSFFVVIPYSPSILQSNEGLANKIFPNKNKNKSTAEEIKAENFEEQRSQLEQRIAVVEQGLVRSGVRVARLGTEEIIELFYKIFNPGETDKPIQME